MAAAARHRPRRTCVKLPPASAAAGVSGVEVHSVVRGHKRHREVLSSFLQLMR